MSFKHRWLAVAALLGCGEQPKLQQATSNLNGTEGMFDFAIDLPWRMEPRLDAQGHIVYDPVPITIAILDEDTNIFSQNFDPLTEGVQMIDRFCSLTVNRVDLDGHRTQVAQFAPEKLSWIEVTGPGDATHTSYWDHNNPVDPIHRVCHPGAENCSSFERILGTSEWHAQALLDFGGLPGARQVVELVAQVSRYGQDCSQPIALRNYAEVFFGDAPLPRFDDGWLYGDLHYHSQSTDNEGESGYAYRGVATSLAAMGVDFTFATDHASDSRQMVDLDAYGQEEFRGLRDLSQPRWDASQHYMHDDGGANTEGAQFAGKRPRLPRIFLGAEVDVMPEIAVRPTTDPPGAAWLVPYGNGLNYNMGDDDGLCEGWVLSCPFQELFTPFVDINGNTAFAVRDTQGLDEHAIGRQHLLHLPRFRDQPTGFVGSRTTKYGGASRHALENNGVLDEIDAKNGIAFLAHPLTHGGGGKGPGFLPYTQYQYEKLFSHHALTGLQLWNEDTRVYSNDGDFGQSGYSYMTPILSDGNLAPGFTARNFEHRPVRDIAAWAWTGERTPASSLHHGTAQWDQLLRWGLDLARTNAISWLPQGEPRRLFMAGGSDAHGDLNYRREGYLFEPKEVNDTALAKVRNLVEVGPVRGPCSAINPKCAPPDPKTGHSQDQIVQALGEGRFAVTDGPALRIVIDRNNNHVIDAADTPMGSIVELFPGEYLPILVEATSTAEFGMLDKIDLYVGVDVDPAACAGDPTCLQSVRSRTYAPVDHAVRTPSDPQANDCGPGICRMDDGYWLPANGNRQRLRAEHINSLHTVWNLGLDPAWFPPDTPRPLTPTRLYVRAFASTTPPCDAHAPTGNFRLGCAARYAYSNPIWSLRRTLAPGQECPYSDRALDNDLDGIPNYCDQFPTQAGGGWTRMFGGQQLDFGGASAIDGFGNIYAVGSVQGNSVRLEGATGSLGSLAAANTDGVLLQYSPTGQLLRRQVLTGLGMQQVRDIAITNSAIYITGIHQQSTTIGSSTVNPASLDVFIARVRTSDLGIDWVKYIDGSGNATVRGIAANDSGMVAVVGDFTGILSPFYAAYPAQGTSDCFVASFAAATGDLRSIQLVDGAGGCTARDIVMDSSGRTTVALTYDGALRISTTITRTTAGTDTAIVRYGNTAESYAPLWATYLGAPFGPGDASALALVLSGNNVLAGGSFTGSFVATGTQWGGTTTTIASSQGGSDGFVVQLDNVGRLLTSPLPTVTGTSDEAITAIAVDTTGRAIVTGQFTSTSTSLNNVTLTREGLYQNSFIAWIAPAGQVLQSRRISTTGGLVTWGKMTATPSGDRAAIAFTFAGTGRFDDLRAVTALGDGDGAVTVQEGPH